MADKLIVVYDERRNLLPLLQETLEADPVEWLDAQTPEELLDYLEESRPRFIVIGVEPPRRGGFTAFSRLCQARLRSAPVVFCTRELPQNDFEMHAKQRLHADHYLNLAEFEGEELRAELVRLFRLKRRSPKKTKPSEPGAQKTEPSDEGDRTVADGPAEVVRDAPTASAQPEAPATRASMPPAAAIQETARTDDLATSREVHDAKIAELLAEVSQVVQGEHPGADSMPAGAEAGPGAASSEEIEALQVEVASLRQQLDESRRYLTTSPFSKEFVTLKEEVERRRADAERTRGSMALQERKLRELALRLARAEQELAERPTGANFDELRDAHRAELEQLRRRLKKKYTSELELAQSRLQDVQEQHAAALAKVRSDYGRLDSAQLEAHELVVSELRGAMEAGETRFQRELEEREEAHAEALHALAQQGAQRVAQVEAHYKEQISRYAEKLVQLEQARDADRQTHAQRFRELEAHQAQSLQNLQQQHATALEALQGELKGERAQAVQLAAQSAEGQMEHLREEYERRIERLRRDFQEEIEARQEREQEARGNLQREHALELSRQAEAHRAELCAREEEQNRKLRKAERERALAQEALEERTKTRISELEAGLKAAQQNLKRARGDSQTSVAELEARHEAALEELDKQRQAEIAELTERMHRAEIRAEEAINSARQDTFSVDSLRQAYEAEIASMDKAHQLALEECENEIRALQQALQATASDPDEARSQVRGQLKAEYDAALEAVERKHAQILASHEQLRDMELSAREDDIARLCEEYEAKLEALKQAYESRLAGRTG